MTSIFGIPPGVSIDVGVIRSLLPTITPDKAGVAPLRDLLESHWPDFKWTVVAEGDEFYRDGGLVDDAGVRIADRADPWIKERVVEQGGDFRAVWNRFKGAAGPLYTIHRGTTLWAFATLGADAAEYLQLEFSLVQECATRRLWSASSWAAPDELDDLLHGNREGESVAELHIGPRRYEYDRAAHLAAAVAMIAAEDRAEREAFVQAHVMLVQQPDNRTDLRPGQIVVQSAHRVSRGARVPAGYSAVEITDYMPGYLDHSPNLVRFFADWAESSAGRLGIRVFDHWSVNLRDHVNGDGRRSVGGTPGWLTSKALPQIRIRPKETAYGLMERLQKFDAKAGHSFAWFFFMTHGNRVDAEVGNLIAEAIEDGLLRLPAWDSKILLAWKADPYGF